MKNKTRTMIFYRRVIRTLVLCMVVAVCIKISLNPSVLKMAYAVDFRNRKSSSLARNNLFGNPGRSTIRTYTLSMLEHANRNEQESNWQSFSKLKTINSVHTSNIWQTTNNQQTAKDLKKASNTASVTTSTTSMSPQKVHGHIKAAPLTNYTYKLSNTKKHSNKSYAIDLHLRANSTKKAVRPRHPNEVDFQMISSGKFIPEDLMKQGPFRFLNNYKNPCWKSTKQFMADPPIRCLPYFYLIGAPKSGTTDMHRRLIQHPDISKLVRKEPHWLTRIHYYSHGKRGGHSNLTSYLRMFTFATREIYMIEDVNGYHRKIFGDCSASTMWDNDYWTILPENRNLPEPLYTNADYIYHLNPNTKIIAMLRNPVQRLYSDYLFFNHGSPELFHEGVVKIIKETDDCLENNTLRHCLYIPSKDRTGIEIRLRIGVYHLHLKEYLRVFPRDQVMVIKLEDFSNKTVSYMQKIFSFLEISDLDQEDLQKIANPERHANTRRKKDKNVGEMLPETRTMLEQFYRPHNERLTELLGETFNYNNHFR